MTQFYPLKFRSLLVIFILLCSLLPTQTFGKGITSNSSGSISGETKVWHKVTITFDGPQTSETDTENPFMDYRLNVTFTNSGVTYVVPGFYAADGNAAESSASSGNKWQVHFAPDRPGTWTYTASFRKGNEVAISLLASAGTPTSFDGATGAFYVSPTDKSAPDLRAKGRLAYVGKRYRQHLGSGEYFVKGGSDSPENFLSYDDFDNTPNIDSLRKSWSPHLQDWKTGDPTWQNGKGKGIIGALNYLSSRGVNAFSFLTLGHKGDDKNVYPWVDPTDPIVYDVSKMAQWDIVFEHADKMGMFMHFKTTERENAKYLDNGDLGPERKLYHRELVARFGYHLALNWNTGEENDTGAAKQKDYAEHFKDIDPYQHLVVMHTSSNQTDQYFGPLIGTVSEYTGGSLNAYWSAVHKETERWVRATDESGKPWVWSNDEQPPPHRGIMPDAGYMGHSGTTTPTLSDTRHSVLWGHLMAGGSGALYYYGYNYPESDLTLQDFRSRDILFGETKVALDFFRLHLPFQEMVNEDSLVGNPTHETAAYCFTKPGEIYAVYVNGGGELDLLLPDSAEYTVKWYNPSSGGALQNGALTKIQGPGATNLGYPPDSSNNDWVALVEKAEPFVTQTINGICITDSAMAQKIDSFFTAIGYNDPYYTPSYVSEECDEDTCGYLTVNAGQDVILTCNDNSHSFVATTNASSPTFIWTAISGNIVSGAQTDSVTVDQVGSYLLTVIDSSGCTQTDTVSVGVNSTLTVDAGPDQALDCVTGTTNLQGAPGLTGTFSWSGPNGFSSTDSMPTVIDSGEYVLTIVSAFGCIGSDTAFVMGNDSLPTADAGPDKFIDCNTPSVTLNGSQSSSGTYSWTGPNGFTASNLNPTVSVEGKYILTVTNAQGCSSLDSTKVDGDFIPEFTTAGDDQELDCNNPTVMIDGSNSDPGTYTWVGPNGFTANIVNPTVSEPGVYTMTNTGSNGCFTTDDVVVTANFTDPIANAGSDQIIDCNSPTVTLDGSGSSAGTYSWTGPNGFNSALTSPVVNEGGTYILHITGANGCTAEDSVVVTVDTSNVFASAGPDLAIGCGNTSVTLDGSASDAGSVLWTGPNGFTANTTNITVSIAGTYIITITQANGCFGKDTAEVTSSSAMPFADAGENDTLTCAKPSITLDASQSDPGTYTWTGPNNFTATGVNPTVVEAGTYILTVTGSNGCTSTAQVVIDEDVTPATSDAGTPQTIDCNNLTVTLNGSGSNGTYSWTGPNGFTSSQLTPLVSVAGTYVLEVTGFNGCLALDSVIVSEDKLVPVADAGADQTIDCNNPSVTLDGSASDPGTISWTGPNGFASSDQSPVVSVAGTYIISITGTNGCLDTDTVEVNSDINEPIADAGSDQTLDCNNPSVTADATNSSAGSYSWTGPNNFVSSSLTPTITEPGTYVLTVTGINGCSKDDTLKVTSDFAGPNADAGPDSSLTCAVTSLVLDGTNSDAGTYSWSGPNVFASTSITPTINEEGTYILQVIGLNGCIGLDSIVVSTDTLAPVADAGPDQTLDCLNGNVTLDGSNSSQGVYEWKGPNGYSSTILNPTTGSPGEYILFVTGTNGCVGTDTALVISNDSIPTVIVGNDLTIDCNNASVTLDGSQSDPGTYSWTGPNGFSASTATTTAILPGVYTLVVTGSNGCSASDDLEVFEDLTPPVANAGPDQIFGCNNSNATLDGTGSDAGTINWSGPNGFTSSIASPVVTVAGTYIISITGTNGCIGKDTVEVTLQTNEPVANAGPDQIIDCNNPTTVLDGSQSDPGTYSWTGPNGFTSSVVSPTASEAGTYVLTVTSAGGCSKKDTVIVSEDFVAPVADAGTDRTIDCNIPFENVNASQSSAGTISWTGPNGFTSDKTYPVATVPGYYVLTITAANGCTAKDSALVTGDFDAPIANAGADQVLDCSNPSVTLDGSASDPGAYSWTGPNGFTSTIASPTATEIGTYILTVTGTNGCTADDTVKVTQGSSSVIANAGPDVEINCTNLTANHTLDGSASDPGTYSWTGPNGFTSTQQSPLASDPGMYILTVTNAGGCSASDTTILTINATTPSVDAGANQILDCNNVVVTLDGSASDPGTYSWTGPNGFTATVVSPSAIEAGIYTLTVTGANGCIASDDVIVTLDDALPVADAGADADIDCNTGNVVINGSASDPGTYSWTGPNGFTSSSVSPTVTEAGTYTLTVTGSNGCSSTDDVVVSENCGVVCNGNAIDHFYLVDAATDTHIIDPLTDGTVIDLAVTGNSLNIGAIVLECGTTVKSIRFVLSGAQNHTKKENLALWALFGNSGNNYYSWNPPLGNYTLTATPYSAKNFGGTVGTPLTITFTVINSVAVNKTAPTTPGNTMAPTVAPTTNSVGTTNAGSSNTNNISINSLSLKQIKVFPNPFYKKKLVIELDGDFGSIINIELFTSSGQLLHKEKRPFSPKVKLDLSGVNLAEGLYQIRVNEASKMIHYLDKGN